MRPVLPLAALCVFAASGCASPTARPLPSPRPLGATIPRSGVEGQTIEEPEGPISLRTALALALLRSPSFSAAAHEVRAAEAGRLQAGLFPNPEVSYSVENTGGSVHGSAETTLLLSQLVELGGKRAARLAVATGETDLAGWDYESRRLDVLTGTARDFAAVLGAQARVRVAEESARIAAEVLEATRARAEAGAVGPVEVRRTEIEAAAAEIEGDRAAADLAGARARLVSNWGEARPRFAEAVGEIPIDIQLPDMDALIPLLDRNPDLARFEAEIALRRAELDAAEAGRYPDLTVGAGRRRFDETNDRAYVFEVSVPLPLFDRNQGAVAGAEARLSAARMRRNAARQRLRAELEAAWASLGAAVREAGALGERVVPWAREILDATTERFRAGKVGYLELLDARRTYADAAAREASSLADVQIGRIEIERLIACPLESVQGDGPGEKKEDQDHD